MKIQRSAIGPFEKPSIRREDHQRVERVRLIRYQDLIFSTDSPIVAANCDKPPTTDDIDPAAQVHDPLGGGPGVIARHPPIFNVRRWLLERKHGRVCSQAREGVCVLIIVHWLASLNSLPHSASA